MRSGLARGGWPSVRWPHAGRSGSAPLKMIVVVVVVVVELIVSKEYYCWSFVLAAATLLLVSLLLFQNFASRGRTALGPTGVSCCCDFVSLKTWLNT